MLDFGFRISECGFRNADGYLTPYSLLLNPVNLTKIQ